MRVLAASGKTCAWSPDGRWIAFDRVPNRGPAGCASELWVVSATGGQPRYLARGDWPNWVGRTGQLFYHSGGRAYSLNVDDPLDKPESILSCDPYFAVSPDGKYLAHSEADRLSVVEISSGQVKARWTAPPPDGQHGMALRWAPNGREVLAGGLHQGEMGLWSFDFEQGKAWQLFPSPVVLGHLSPDGSRIALELRDWYGGLWLAKLDPADSVHEAVRSARTEEQYLRQSCRDFAEGDSARDVPHRCGHTPLRLHHARQRVKRGLLSQGPICGCSRHVPLAGRALRRARLAAQWLYCGDGGHVAASAGSFGRGESGLGTAASAPGRRRPARLDRACSTRRRKSWPARKPSSAGCGTALRRPE